MFTKADILLPPDQELLPAGYQLLLAERTVQQALYASREGKSLGAPDRHVVTVAVQYGGRRVRLESQASQGAQGDERSQQRAEASSCLAVAKVRVEHQGQGRAGVDPRQLEPSFEARNAAR